MMMEWWSVNDGSQPKSTLNADAHLMCWIAAFKMNGTVVVVFLNSYS